MQNFIFFSHSSGCGQDYLELRNGLFTTSRRIGGRLCGSGTYVFTTSRGEALIQYRTDGFNRGSGSFNGFRVSYTSIGTVQHLKITDPVTS